VPSRRARSSVFGKGGEAGTERPTIDAAESKGLEAEVEAASASQDVDDWFRTSDEVSGTGAGISVGACVDGVSRISLVSGSAHCVDISLGVVPSSGKDDITVGGMSCSALGGGASVGRGVV
jgi:hypothetical protein